MSSTALEPKAVVPDMYRVVPAFIDLIQVGAIPATSSCKLNQIILTKQSPVFDRAQSQNDLSKNPYRFSNLD